MGNILSGQKPQISMETRLCRSMRMTTANIADEICMLDFEKGKYYAMDPIGSRIWDLLDKPQAVGSIVETLLAEYKVDRQQCMEQVLEFTGKLCEQEILIVEG